MKIFAPEFYRSRQGNCAQSIQAAWKNAGSPGTDKSHDFSSCGHGRAPEGMCGALHAACTIAGKEASERIKAEFLKMTGGHASCREIKGNRAATCFECIEKAAELLEDELCAVPV